MLCLVAITPKQAECFFIIGLFATKKKGPPSFEGIKKKRGVRGFFFFFVTMARHRRKGGSCCTSSIVSRSCNASPLPRESHLIHFVLLMLLVIVTCCVHVQADSLVKESTTQSSAEISNAPIEAQGLSNSISLSTLSPSVSNTPSYSPSETHSTTSTKSLLCGMLSDVSACYNHSSATNCGWSVARNNCENCSNVDYCNDGCYFDDNTEQCLSTGKPCRLITDEDLCLQWRYADQPCMWLSSSDSHSCTSCPAFNNSLAPCPSHFCYRPSVDSSESVMDLTCTSYEKLCSLRSPAECDNSSEWECFLSQDGRDVTSCLWCGSYRTKSACNNETGGACQWRSDLCRSVGPSQTLPTPNTSDVGLTDFPRSSQPPTAPIEGKIDYSTSVIIAAVASVAGALLVVVTCGVVIVIRRRLHADAEAAAAARYVGGGIRNLHDASLKSMVSSPTTTDASTEKGVAALDIKGETSKALSGEASVKKPAVLSESGTDVSREEEIRNAKIVRMIRKRKYRQTKLIGRGSHGSVYHCVLDDGGIVAVKEILFAPASHDELQTIMQEVQLVSSLRHPNIIQYYTSLYESSDMRFSIFMQNMSNGSLGELVRSSTTPLSDDLGRVYARQITTALAFLHDNGVVHRDLKCDNLLLTAEGQLKLSDFGAAKHIGADTTGGAQTMIGTPFFMAPEILCHDPRTSEKAAETGDSGSNDGDTQPTQVDETGYGKRCDVWSLGITILEMMNCGIAPWPVQNVGATMLHIANPNSKPIYPPHLSTLARDFVEKCCLRDPLARATSTSLLQHPWLVDAVVGDEIHVVVEDENSRERTPQDELL